MKDISRPQLLSKFGRKTQKFVVAHTCPKFVSRQKIQLGPLGVNCNFETKKMKFEKFLFYSI